jgi:thiamine-phosphate pyrophosphorylase
VIDPGTLLLVAITDGLRDGADALLARAAAAVRGGATMLQLRLKDVDARTQVEVARRLVALRGAPVVVNDRADVALAAGAAGVHVGADDLPIEAVRRIAPAGFIVGASVGSDEEADRARAADYIGIGPVYDTASKGDAGAALGVEEAARLARRCGVPAVGVGGISAATAPAVTGAGLAGVAVIHAIFGAADPERAARSIRAAIGR